MDAKMRANFINSVAGGQKIPCPSCNTLNNAGSRFCITCGSKIESSPAAMTTNEDTTMKEHQEISCPSCNTINGVNSRFCISCGMKLESVSESTNEAEVKPAFNPVAPTTTASVAEPSVVKRPEKKMAFNFVAPAIEEVEEPVSVFAEGLPDWDIVPPQIMVRRKAKR